MRDYAELVKQTRESLSEVSDCMGCCVGWSIRENKCLLDHCADAIEELLAAVRSVVRCKDCEWWTKQEASIQGRCARLAIYPTGEFYCASGSKRELPKEDAE